MTIQAVNTMRLRADADPAVHWTGLSIKTAASHITNAREMLRHIECRCGNNQYITSITLRRIAVPRVPVPGPSQAVGSRNFMVMPQMQYEHTSPPLCQKPDQRCTRLFFGAE